MYNIDPFDNNKQIEGLETAKSKKMSCGPSTCMLAHGIFIKPKAINSSFLA